MGAHICLFALFATAIFATPVVEEDQSDITIPSTHGYLIVEEGDVYLYVEEGDEDIYLYYESFTQDDEIVIAFDDPTGGGVAGISVTMKKMLMSLPSGGSLTSMSPLWKTSMVPLMKT